MDVIACPCLKLSAALKRSLLVKYAKVMECSNAIQKSSTLVTKVCLQTPMKVMLFIKNKSLEGA